MQENSKTRIICYCPIRRSMELLGGKWKLIIIYILDNRTLRYGELKRLIPEISDKMLIQELKELVDSGILHKDVYAEIPPRAEYSLTERGLKVLPIIEHLQILEEGLNFRLAGHPARRVASWMTARLGRPYDHRQLDRCLEKMLHHRRVRQRSLPALPVSEGPSDEA